jgi:phenylacetate-CoA ligase
MLIISGVNVYPSAVRDVIATLAPAVTAEMVIKLDEPPPSVKPPMKIHVEHGEDPGDLEVLKQKIQHLLRDKLIFPSNITLVPPGTLPKFEYKAKLVEY